MARRRSLCLWLGLGAATAMELVSGWWQWKLWHRFGNPLFPFYNDIFRSPDFVVEPFHDNRFLPASLWQGLTYPWYWLAGGSPNMEPSPTCELWLRDARFFAITALLVVVFCRIAANLLRRRPDGVVLRTIRHPASGLVVAFCIAYATWLFQFAIQRYAVPLELMCGVVILHLASVVGRGWARLGCLAAICIVAVGDIKIPDWGRVPWRARWQSLEEQALGLDPAPIIFLTTQPSSYVVASLPRDARYVGLFGRFDLNAAATNSLARQLTAMLAAQPPHRLYAVLGAALPAVAQAVLAGRGLRVGERCMAVPGVLETFRLCEVVAAG